jgi:hypothetical protein
MTRCAAARNWVGMGSAFRWFSAVIMRF